MKILRFFTVIVCIFIILSLFGCGKINIRPLLDKLPHDKIQLDNVLIEGVADAVATTAEGKTTEAVEYGGFNIVTAEIETEAVITEAITEVVVETVATEFFEVTVAETEANGCNHLHVQEAAELFETHGGLFSNPQEDHNGNLEYCAKNRLVVAYGGLRLREAPIDGTQVGLILDGDIIQILGHKNGWAYTCYDGIYGWCSMEYLFDPYLYPTAGGAPIAKAKATRSGIKLVTNRRCDDKDEVSTTLPRSTMLRVYRLEHGAAYVQYKNIFGWCSTEYLEISEWTYEDAIGGPF